MLVHRLNGSIVLVYAYAYVVSAMGLLPIWLTFCWAVAYKAVLQFVGPRIIDFLIRFRNGSTYLPQQAVQSLCRFIFVQLFYFSIYFLRVLNPAN